MIAIETHTQNLKFLSTIRLSSHFFNCCKFILYGFVIDNVKSTRLARTEEV